MSPKTKTALIATLKDLESQLIKQAGSMGGEPAQASRGPGFFVDVKELEDLANGRKA